MERKLRNKYLLITFWTVLGFFVGSSVYVINGGDSNVGTFFAKAAGAAIVHVISTIVIFRKNPKLKTLEKILSKDERNSMIQGVASQYSFLGTLILVFGVMVIGEIQGKFYLSFGAAIFAGVMLLMYYIIFRLISKRM